MNNFFQFFSVQKPVFPLSPIVAITAFGEFHARLLASVESRGSPLMRLFDALGRCEVILCTLAAKYWLGGSTVYIRPQFPSHFGGSELHLAFSVIVCVSYQDVNASLISKSLHDETLESCSHRCHATRSVGRGFEGLI